MDDRKFNQRMICDELEERTKRNPRYSLRAFARDLGLSPSTISEVINGHHAVSKRCAEKIVRHCDWSEEKKKKFLDAIDVSKKTQTSSGKKGASGAAPRPSKMEMLRSS